MVERSTTSSTDSGDNVVPGNDRDTSAPVEPDAPVGSGESGETEDIETAAAAALARAREAARAAGLRPTASGRPARRRRPPAGDGAVDVRGADRDPVLLGPQLGRLVAERGWEADVAVGSVVARWPALVGAEVAQHVTPESFDGGVLVVRADSTSWATNLRYMVPLLLERLAAEVGDGVVGDLRVLGPAAPSWRRGRRSAPGGRGPRDTYG